MATIVPFPFVRYLDNARTDISFIVDEFSKRNGYTYIGSNNGTIERYQNGILISCGPYQFGLTTAEIKALKKYAYAQQKIVNIWRVPQQITEFRILEDRVEILEQVMDPKHWTRHPYLQTTRYAITVITSHVV